MALGKFRSWETIYPYLGGAIAAGGAAFLDVKTPSNLDQAGISLPALFSTLQNFQLFGTGVLFSVFVFTMAPAAGFVKKLQNLNIFRVFRRYTIEAMVIGVCGWLLCAPLSASKPHALELAPYPLISVVAVLFGAAFAFSLFRVVRIFLFWSSQRG